MRTRMRTHTHAHTRTHKVTREDVADLDELDAKDRRALWQWIQKNQPEKEPEKPKKKKLSKKKVSRHPEVNI